MVNKLYRICENKYNWFKIERWRPSFRLLWLIPISGKWKDAEHYDETSEPVTFESKLDAEKQIKKYQVNADIDLRSAQRKNNNWICV